MRRLNLGHRDAGQLLGVSFQRAQQLERMPEMRGAIIERASRAAHSSHHGAKRAAKKGKNIPDSVVSSARQGGIVENLFLVVLLFGCCLVLGFRPFDRVSLVNNLWRTMLSTQQSIPEGGLPRSALIDGAEGFYFDLNINKQPILREEPHVVVDQFWA